MREQARIGVVLGGGGLVGHAWHVGVLAGIAEATGWDARGADLIVGTSAGAVVAAELRAGHRPCDLLCPGEGAAPTTVPRLVLGRRSFRPAAPAMVVRRLRRRRPAPLGLVAAAMMPRGRRDAAIVGDAVARLAPTSPRWPPGLWVCTTRLHDGERVVLDADSGADLATAVAASCAMAGFFAPVPIAGHDHIDGGARSVSNADVVVDEDLDLVVVSSPMSIDRAAAGPARGFAPRLARRQRLGHGARLARELAQVRSRGALVVSLEPGPEDVAVLGGCGASMDFGRRDAVAHQARDSALRRFASAPLAEVASVLAGITSTLPSRAEPGVPVR